MRQKPEILIVFLYFLFSLNGYGIYFTPVNIPKSTYVLDLNFDFNNCVLTGLGTVSFINEGIRPIDMIAFDYAINDRNLLRLSQEGKELSIFSSDGKKKLNNPVYFILNTTVESGDSLVLNVEFKRRLFIDPDPVDFEHKNLIPRLWWDGIVTSDKFEVKINELPGYSVAMSGRYNAKNQHYENNHVKNFGFFFSKECTVIEENVNGVQVRVLYPENGKQVAEIVLNTAKEAIPFYIKLLGMYPYAFINILPGGPGVWGGYPFASGMVVIHGMQFFDKGSVRHWRWITAHEIGHEYWGEYVLDGDEPSWLWIALGIYADREFTKFTGLSDIRHRGWAEKYLDGAKKGYDTRFDIHPSEEAVMDFDRNNYVIHAKGFSFISALEMVLGKEVFQEAYRKTLEKFGGERLGYRDFQKVCEGRSGENLNWFFDPWVNSSDYLSATVGDTKAEKTDEGYTSVVSIYHEGDLIMPVPVYANFEDGTVQVKFSNRFSRKSIVKFKRDSPITGASIDPSGYLANMVSPPEPDEKKVINDIQMLSYTGSGEKAYRVYRKAAQLDPGQMGEHWYKLGMCLFDGGYYYQSERAFRNAVKYGPEEDQFINQCWYGHLLDVRGKRGSAIEAYKKALEVSEGDFYTHSQYNLEVNKSWVEKRLETPFSMGEPLSW